MEEKPRILIVDDRVENLIALERMLGDMDIELVRAASGSQALVLALQHDFALALVDVQMPGMDGYETVSLLHQEAETELLPVIFMAKIFPGHFNHLKGLEAGAIDFIEKPLNPALVRGKISIFLKLYKSRKFMEKANQWLEAKVAEKTASLADTNRTLQKEIQERCALEQRMGQAQKMEALGTMAGGIAHDFNNILAIIQLNAAMALDNLDNGQGADEEIREILGATTRARDLTMKILTFSHKHERKDEITYLPRVIEDMMKMLRSVIPTSVEFVMDLHEKCRPVCIDPLDISQVMMNLCINASQAMDEQGRLTIALREVLVDERDIGADQDVEPGIYARLTVADTGCGIEEEIKERIFDPFFTTKPSGKGTGMGLAVVYGIVHTYKGMVRVESNRKEGTAFHLYFPATEKAASADIVSEDREKEVPINGSERILFVDDEKELAALGKRIMEKHGYRVSFFSSSREALVAFQEDPHQFDLVITDHTMPDLTGLDLAREMLAVRRDLPIILCTGYTSKVSTRNFRQHGFRELLPKPYKPADLLAVIRGAVEDQGFGDQGIRKLGE